jgi:tripartite ATP-independent transporter DctM subunit
MRAGLAVSVSLVGMLLAASTGVVGATVVAMGLMSLPTMLKHGYSKPLATGSICAAGTLGQIIPPSILLILLTDQITNAYRVAQTELGNMSPESVSVLDLFAGAIVPGLVLVAFYVVYQLVYGLVRGSGAPAVPAPDWMHSPRAVTVRILRSLLPPLLLIIAVLGSIIGGIATATEAAGVGAVGATILAALGGRLNLGTVRMCALGTTGLSGMIFTILIGATMFSLVFRGLGGDEMVHDFLTGLPGGVTTALLLVMLTVFVLGFVLDFIEIMIIVIPVVGPPLFMLDVHPIWFAILLSVNLQTSFLTPPFGFSLFYLQGVTPPGVSMGDIYKGVVPFIAIQLLVLALIWSFPEIATWLPDALAGRELFQ